MTVKVTQPKYARHSERHERLKRRLRAGVDLGIIEEWSYESTPHGPRWMIKCDRLVFFRAGGLKTGQVERALEQIRTGQRTYKVRRVKDGHVISNAF